MRAETVCFIAFYFFSLLIIIAACSEAHKVTHDYYSLAPDAILLCSQYIVWKLGILFHIIFLFFSMLFFTFIISKLDMYQEINMSTYDSTFGSLFLAFRLCFPCVYGSILLSQTIYSVVYYSEIKNNCSEMEDSVKEMLLYFIISFGSLSIFFMLFGILSCITFCKKLMRVRRANSIDSEDYYYYQNRSEGVYILERNHLLLDRNEVRRQRSRSRTHSRQRSREMRNL